MRDPRKAAARRKLYQQAGTKAAVLQWESVIVDTVQKTVSKIKRDATSGRADVMKWWSMMTADILGSLAFGEPFRLIEKKRYVAWPPILASTKTHVWTKKTSLIRDIDLSMIFIGVRMELPLIWNLVHRIPLPGVGKPDALFERFSEYGKVAVENTKAAPRGSAKTLFSKMLPEDGEQPFPDSLIAQESANIIIAGSDTTAMALTYLIYAVLIAPDIKSKLLSELSGCSPIPGWEELEGKPYLNKVISETLRLYAPVPASLPRTVPQGGTSLVGYRIPAETTVVTQAYTFHRDPAIWSEPER